MEDKTNNPLKQKLLKQLKRKKSVKKSKDPNVEVVVSELQKMPPTLVENENSPSQAEGPSETATTASTVNESRKRSADDPETGEVASKKPKKNKQRENVENIVGNKEKQEDEEKRGEKKDKEDKKKRREDKEKRKDDKDKRGDDKEKRKEDKEKRREENREKKKKDKTKEDASERAVPSRRGDDDTKSLKPLKVDKAALRRKLKEYHESHSTLKSRKSQSGKSNKIGGSKADASQANTGWRKSWDNYFDDFFAAKSAKKPKKEIEVINTNASAAVTPEIPKTPEVQESYDIFEEPEVITEPTIKKNKDHLKDDIFGFRSVLNDQTRLIFRAYSTAGSEEPDSLEPDQSVGPDMTWVRELSASDTKSKRKSVIRHRIKQKRERDPLYVIWLYLVIGARWPFIFVRSPDPASRLVSCKFDRHRRFFYAFLVTSIFLCLLTMITIISFVGIFFEDEDKDDPLTQVEKLLLDKNLVTGIVFVTTLLMATISSFSVLNNGEAMAEYITQWEESLDELDFNATTGIRLLTIIFILWSIIQTVGEALMFYYFKSELNPFIEGVHLMIVLVFRNLDRGTLSSAYRNYYGALVILLNNYALYCARSVILLVMVFSVGMTNIAHEWNFRLRLILRNATTMKHETSIRDLLKNLNYRKMFDEHQKIVKLVKDTSSVFGFILLMFFLTQAVDLAGELVEIAVDLVALQGLENNTNANFTQLSPDSPLKYPFEKDVFNRVDLAFHFSQTTAIIVIVSVYLAATGEAMMDALHLVTRHTHMRIVSTHQRDFMMSLQMSFNPKQPYLLGTGGLLDVDKPFLFSFFAVGVYFLSVMVQTRIPRLLTVPIVFPCADGSGRICSQQMQIPLKDKGIYEMNLENLPGFTTTLASSTALSTQSTTAIMTMATTAIATMTATTTTMSRTTTTTTPPPPLFPCPGAGIPGSQLFKCKGAEVNRILVYDEKGRDKSSRLQNTFNCLYNPYPESLGPYFDCFGNNLTIRDSCGMLNFGFGMNNRPSMSPKTIMRRKTWHWDINCHDLDSTFYNVIGGRIDPNFYTCGIPNWLASLVCFKNSAAASPRDLTLFDFQSALGMATIIDSARDHSCSDINTKSFGPDGYFTPSAFIFSPTDTNMEGLRNLPVGSPTARRYFPFFHPQLLGPFITISVVSLCPSVSGGSGTEQAFLIPLVPDNCGGLDFERAKTMDVSVTGPDGTIYRCFKNFATPKYCTVEKCKEWMDYLNNSPDKPVLT